MRITIRSLRDSPFFIEVDEEATIFSVKSAITRMNGVFPSHQSIIYQGNILSNETTISSLNFPANKQASLYLVISKEQRERLKKEREVKKNHFSNPLFDSSSKTDLFSSSSDSFSQGFGIQNNTCFDSIMKNITDKSPNFSHALNDKEALYESYDAFRDPGKRLELLKSIDRTLNLAESKAGCYREIIEHQRLVTEAVDDAIDKYMHEINPTYYENLYKTVIPENPLDEPSCEPINMDLNHAENFMDSLLQRQLMLVMTLPNGTQKLVTVKKNTDAVLKIMQLMMNLQAKSQKSQNENNNKSNFNQNNNIFGGNDFISDTFDFKNNNDDDTLNDNYEKDNEDDNFEFGNGMKKLESESQMNLLKLLMMSILSDENSENNDENKNKFTNKPNADNGKNLCLFNDGNLSEGNTSKDMMFHGWNNLFDSNDNNKHERNQNDFNFQKQPTYEQVFNKSQESLQPSQLATDCDSELDSVFCLNSNSSNSDFQPIADEDDDSFFNFDYFSMNNEASYKPNEMVQPRTLGNRNTTYYSPTADSIKNAKESQNNSNNQKGESNCFNYEFSSGEKSNNIDCDENDIEDQNEVEEKRRKGWKFIFDLVNNPSQSCQLDNDIQQPDIKVNNSNNDKYQNKFNFNEDDDSSDISID